MHDPASGSRKVVAVLFIALLAGQRVSCVRDSADFEEIARDEEQSRKFGFEDVATGRDPAGDILQELMTVVGSDETLCTPETKVKMLQARQGILEASKQLADKCQEAQSSHITKCLSASEGPTAARIMKSVLRYTTLVQKATECDWAAELASTSLSEFIQPLVGNMTIAYANSPEAKKTSVVSLNFDAVSDHLERMQTRTEDDVGSVKADLFTALVDIFGKQDEVAKGVTPTTLEEAVTDKDEVDAADEAAVEGLAEVEMELPQWCFRKAGRLGLFFGDRESGCENKGETCFRFISSTLNSETLNDPEAQPDDEMLLDAQLTPCPKSITGWGCQSHKQKNSRHTWGICLPKVDPAGKLSTIQTSVASLARASSTSVDVADGAVAAAAEADEKGDKVVLLERHGVDTKYIGYLLQIPAALSLLCIGIGMVILIFLMLIGESVAKALTGWLNYLGGVGIFIKALIFWPFCFVGQIAKRAIGIAAAILTIIYMIGSMLGGSKECAGPDLQAKDYSCFLPRKGSPLPSFDVCDFAEDKGGVYARPMRY